MSGAIRPESKDWTWVLHRRCDACGFDPAGLTPPLVADRIRALVPRWHDVLARPGAAVRARPDRWSELEYGGHVRDLSAVFDTRVHAMLDTEAPVFPDWDQDAAAAAYSGEDPRHVAEGIVVTGERLADSLAAVAPELWHRPGTRSDGASFTVATLAIYALHEHVHHAADVGTAD